MISLIHQQERSDALQVNKRLLIFILMTGVFGILNTEMGFIGILPYIAQRYDVTIVHAGLLISLFALGVALSRYAPCFLPVQP